MIDRELGYARRLSLNSLRVFLQYVVTLGRFRGRPNRDAMEIFELGLAIGQLYRMDREDEAREHYEKLLDLACKVIR